MRLHLTDVNQIVKTYYSVNVKLYYKNNFHSSNQGDEVGVAWYV